MLHDPTLLDSWHGSICLVFKMGVLAPSSEVRSPSLIITRSKAWQRNISLFLIFCSVVLPWTLGLDQAWSILSTTDILLFLKSKYLETKSFEVHQKHRNRECVPYARLSHTDVRKINKYYKAECSGRGGWNNTGLSSHLMIFIYRSQAKGWQTACCYMHLSGLELWINFQSVIVPEGSPN